jgi:CubicO group peptidase (beta-lactamase class C family)
MFFLGQTSMRLKARLHSDRDLAMTRWALGMKRFLLASVAFLLSTATGGCGKSDTGIVYESGEQTSGMHLGLLHEAAGYAGGSGVVVRGGKLVYQWGDPDRLYDLKSTTKSIGSAALGLAIQDRLIKMEDKLIDHLPDLDGYAEGDRAADWVKEISFFHLSTHTAGFEKPGGYVPLLFRPGTKWGYSDSGPNWVADALTYLYRRDLQELLFERVFTPLGISTSDLTWRENRYREKRLHGIPRREFGSGVSANVKAMARFGELYLNKGSWQGQQILPRDFVASVGRTPTRIEKLPVQDPAVEHAGASGRYGILWWNNSDGSLKGVPKDAFWAWGLYESIILVIPSLDIVAARAGDTILDREKLGRYRVLEPFFKRIAASVNFGAPAPNSQLIASVVWGDRTEIACQAEDSDNWPITWADDGHLYASYGDGFGFEPKVPKNLSMGFARIEGDPPRLKGANIRSESGETYGNGPRGMKASGLLMIDGKLWMAVRNIKDSGEQAQLWWSSDYAKSWQRGDLLPHDFGCPTFLNYGKSYEGARDDYVYIYSQRGPSAYEPYDGVVLARVSKDRIGSVSEFEYFQKMDAGGHPVWIKTPEKIGPILEHKGGCFRLDVVYNPGVERYLLLMAYNFESGWGLYEAKDPWGPWSTVYHTEKWDLPGIHSYRLPPKWIAADGKSMYLLFSGLKRNGFDAFCTRKLTLKTIP